MLSLLHSLTVFNKHKHEEYMDNIYIIYIMYLYVYITRFMFYCSGTWIISIINPFQAIIPILYPL